MNKINRLKFKIYDKTSELTSGLYGVQRFKHTEHLENVKRNHNAIVTDMGGTAILMLEHVFGTEIVDGDLIDDFSIEPHADAAVTTMPGILLCVQTADCMPLLLTTEDVDVIGVVHCSWHTLKNNIVQMVVKKMAEKEAKNISAIIGPAIHQKSYEVDDSFRAKMLADYPEIGPLFISSKKEKRWLFDLPGFCIFQLKKSGVSIYKNLCEDTYSNPEKYYSYRRDVHQDAVGEKTNNLSVIMIEHS